MQDKDLSLSNDADFTENKTGRLMLLYQTAFF